MPILIYGISKLRCLILNTCIYSSIENYIVLKLIREEIVPRGNLGVKNPLRRTSELSKLPEEPGIPVSTWTRRIQKANNNPSGRINSTTSTSPVVLVAGPGPDGKLVIKPPEGTWIITNRAGRVTLETSRSNYMAQWLNN